MKKFTTLATITLLIGIPSILSHAQTLPERGPIPFASFDRNHDGYITSAEFEYMHNKRIQERAKSGYPMRNAGNVPDFTLFDTNKDGKLTPKELHEGQSYQMQQRVGQGGLGKNGQGMGMGRGPRP